MSVGAGSQAPEATGTVGQVEGEKNVSEGNV